MREKREKNEKSVRAREERSKIRGQKPQMTVENLKNGQNIHYITLLPRSSSIYLKFLSISSQ